MSATAFPTLREEIDWLLAQQPLLLKLGVMASRLVEATEVLRWTRSKLRIPQTVSDERVAISLAEILIDVLWSLGDDENERARAARMLYGVDPTSMGLQLSKRRRLAALQVRIERADGRRAISVESFSRLHQPGIERDVAWMLATIQRGVSERNVG